MSQIIDKAIEDFHGGIDELESAIGVLAIGRHGCNSPAPARGEAEPRAPTNATPLANRKR